MDFQVGYLVAAGFTQLIVQEMIIFLQCLPTQLWGDQEISLLLSEAYVLKMVWAGADGHLSNLPVSNGNFGMLGR